MPQSAPLGQITTIPIGSEPPTIPDDLLEIITQVEERGLIRVDTWANVPTVVPSPEVGWLLFVEEDATLNVRQSSGWGRVYPPRSGVGPPAGGLGIVGDVYYELP